MPDAVLLSVVCPIYNCEQYMSALVQSLVVGANRSEIEILFVDDCSTDDSRKRLEQELSRHKHEMAFRHLILAHERNRGLSAARNTGIAASKGRYVGFLDGDDALLPGYAERVLPELQGGMTGGNLEILEFAYKEFTDDREILAPPLAATPSVETYTGKERHKTLFRHGFFAWLRIYRRDLVESVMFKEDGRAYEDIPFSMDAFARASEVRRIDAVLVGYRKCAGSITSVRNRRFLDQFLHLVESMERNRKKLGGGLILESRYLFKLCIVLLKALKIRPQNDRLEFYRTARAYAHRGDSLWSVLSTTASRIFSGLLFYLICPLRSG